MRTAKHLDKGRIASHAALLIPFSLWMKLTATGLITVFYHMVSDDEVAHVKNLYGYKGVREFQRDLDFLLRKFHPVALHDVLDSLRARTRLRENSFLLTFDDGFKEMHDIVSPILLKKGIPAVFFVNNAFVDNKALCYQHKASILLEKLREANPPGLERALRELLKENRIESCDAASGIKAIRYPQKEIIDEMAQLTGLDCGGYLREKQPYLTSTQIRNLIGNGFAVGGHSIDHPMYPDIPADEQLRQTLESMRFVKEKFNLNYGAFAFPHTSNGVPKRLFETMYESGLIDISFGTGGFVKDSFPNHVQRLSLEKPLIPAGNIIAREFVRQLARRRMART